MVAETERFGSLLAIATGEPTNHALPPRIIPKSGGALALGYEDLNDHDELAQRSHSERHGVLESPGGDRGCFGI